MVTRRKIRPRRATLLALVIVVAKIVAARSFAILPSSAADTFAGRRVPPSQLHAASPIQHDAKALGAAATTPSPSVPPGRRREEDEERLPAWVNLPSRRREYDSHAEAAPGVGAIEELEMLVGRIAMVGATGILLKELVSGESILEQVTDVLGTLHL